MDISIEIKPRFFGGQSEIISSSFRISGNSEREEILSTLEFIANDGNYFDNNRMYLQISHYAVT